MKTITRKVTRSVISEDLGKYTDGGFEQVTNDDGSEKIGASGKPMVDLGEIEINQVETMEEAVDTFGDDYCLTAINTSKAVDEKESYAQGIASDVGAKITNTRVAKAEQRAIELFCSLTGQTLDNPDLSDKKAFKSPDGSKWTLEKCRIVSGRSK